jgi:hypothetical protein
MSDMQTTGTKEDHGSFLLFKPPTATTIAAIYGHGVENDEIDPISGITLGYYCVHGDTVLANITWATKSPTHPPALTNGKWSNYTLSSLGLDPKVVDQLQGTADSNGVAIVYMTDATSTSAVISSLSALGYSEIRGVHCRESLDKTEESDYGLADAITHDALVNDGWLDSATEAITDDTVLAKDDDICNSSYKIYKIVEVVSDSPPKSYKIAAKLD